MATAKAEEAAGRPAEAAGADAATAQLVARIRRLMLVSGLGTILAIALVLGIIGYRIFKSGERSTGAPTEATLILPAGAKIIQTTVAGDRIVITIDINGMIEIRTYDLRTLKPLGRLNFSSVP